MRGRVLALRAPLPSWGGDVRGRPMGALQSERELGGRPSHIIAHQGFRESSLDVSEGDAPARPCH